MALLKIAQQNREMHVALIDIEKDYINVPLSCPWREMKNLFLIQAIQKYYEHNSASIKIGNEFVAPIETTN